MKTCFKLSALASALALAMGPASAADVYLAAKLFTKYLPVSGGTTEPVPMWGYVTDTDEDGDGFGDCSQATDNTARAACIDTLPDPTLPGPRLTVDPADPTLTIHLSNGLSEPTSIVIPGQALPTSGGGGPTWNDSGTGQRVRSYGSEAAANGGFEFYSWNLARSGTFMYHSGTWPQKQVYMGLYGAVSKDAAAGEVYAGVPYDNEVVLFYSDVDPAHNAAVAAQDPAYTPIRYHAQWFLVNGEPYEYGVTADIPAGSAVTGPGDTRSNTLVRLLSAASETHVPTLQGLYMSIHAEDGLRYNWQNGDAFGDFAPREQYSAMLPPLKTKDAIIGTKAEGTYAVYDGNGYMTNPSDPNDFDQGDELGGMLRFLSVGAANQAPDAVDDAATTPEDTPVDIDVLTNDSDPDGDTLTIVSVTQGSIGSATISDSACCVLYTPNPNMNGLDSFDYTVSDSNGVTSTATAMVDVTVTAVNDPPVAAVDGYTTDEDVALVVPVPGVLGNDSDVDVGDVLTAVPQTGPANGTLVLNANGSFTYTPNANYNGGDDFTYVANDATADSNVATVSITVNAVNDAPVIISAAVLDATVDVAYSYDVDATDADGDTLAYALDASPAGMTIDSGTGVISWTPVASQEGSNAVTVSVTDSQETVTQSYTVTAAPAPSTGPLLYFSTRQGGANGSVPDVAAPYNNADIYAYDGALYSRIVDAGFAGNVDALHVVDADHFYVSFANNGGVTNGGVTFQDEDIAYYNAGAWSMYFDGSADGLQSGGPAGGTGYDIDAISIDGGVLYFSTFGNANVSGLGSGDDADIYSWNGSAFAREFDASAAGLVASPQNAADIDGLTVTGSTYYMSLFAGTTAVPTLGAVNDEAVVSFDGTTWTLYFSGPGLTGGGRDLDAVHVP